MIISNVVEVRVEIGDRLKKNTESAGPTNEALMRSQGGQKIP